MVPSMAQRGAMLPPTIKQEATAHLAAMMSPPVPTPAAPAAPDGVWVKRELPVGAQGLADLALPPPKRPRAAEAAVAGPGEPTRDPVRLAPLPATDERSCRLCRRGRGVCFHRGDVGHLSLKKKRKIEAIDAVPLDAHEEEALGADKPDRFIIEDDSDT